LNFIMCRSIRLFAVVVAISLSSLPALAAPGAGGRKAPAGPPQETGFLNRRIEVKSVTYRYQVYLPEGWKLDDGKKWPTILFLHGRGERGSEGMWQTQIGLPSELRDHPDRWPFIVVMPQIPDNAHWTDSAMMKMAMAALDRETAEFHGDPDRTYLTGLSLGGYGVWELARAYPHRWAAIAIASGGIFWSYEPSRWLQVSTLPAEYASAIGSTPIWLFHGTDDPIVIPRQDEVMFDALKASSGHVRLWLYQGVQHDSWSRAYNEPELPKWLLAHRNDGSEQHLPPSAERLLIPPHPPAIKLTLPTLDAVCGEYLEPYGHSFVSIYRQGDTLFEKDQYGGLSELAAESQFVFFYPHGSDAIRVFFERDREGRVIALVIRDDRHEERWEKQITASRR
jgi:poly(3-hydroxybutyrate) depolymerase